jgi:Ca2+-binding EF-hand superfamily protein
MKRAWPVLCGIAIVCALSVSVTQKVAGFGVTDAGNDSPVVAGRPTLTVAANDAPVVAVKPSSFAADPIPTDGLTMEGDSQDIVYLSPQGPVFIRVHVQVNGRPFRELRDGYSATLFASLDLDKNGVLDANEMKQVPPPAQLGFIGTNGVGFSQFLTKPVDYSPRDGKVTREELDRYVRDSAGAPFEIAAEPNRNSIETDLFKRIDGDRNGCLTAHEFRAARDKLWKMDVNDDELVSSSELAVNAANPYRAARLPPANTVANFAQLLLPVDASSPSAVYRKMMQMYDKYSRNKEGAFDKDGQLTVEELRLGPEMAATFDTNRDGRLGNKEVAAMFREPRPQMELLVKLDTSGAGKSSLEILTKSTEGATNGFEARLDGTRHIRLTLGETLLDVVTGELPDNEPELARYFDANFKAGDGDNNEYLDKNEIQALVIPAYGFGIIDRDGDGKIFKKELLEYIHQQAQLSRSRAAIRLSNENKSLFEMLDSNDDTRLSAREFMASIERLEGWDRNGDGKIDQDELPKNFQMSFGLAQPNLFGRTAEFYTRLVPTGQMLPATGEGPKWFTKMDRNRDGDVSQREFLGPAETFTQLDRDTDGLLTASEAAGAK